MSLDQRAGHPGIASMFQFEIDPEASKAVRYARLLEAAEALTADEADTVAAMANLAALLWQGLPDLNWAGFYRVLDGGLVLGPFIGKPACVRIAAGRGVCGAALATGQTQCVADVHAFPGHIACDAASRSELVVPVFASGGAVSHVIDLDSPVAGRFDAEDAAGIEALARRIGPRLS